MKIPFAKIETFLADPDSDSATLLKSAWLDVEGARLLATNGHMAIRLNVECDEEDVSGPVPREAFDLARKELKAIQKRVKESLPDPWLKVVCNSAEVFIQNLLTNTTHLVPRAKVGTGDKPFPDLDAVFPSLSEKPTITVSAAYLADIAKSLETPTLSLFVQADDKVVILASSDGPSVAALMPMRGTVDVMEVNRRGRSKATPKPKDGTTVSMGIPNPVTGKVEYTEPMPHSEFIKRVDDIVKDKLQ